MSVSAPYLRPVGDRFFGKYRAVVVENLDPMSLGRLKVDVTAIPGVAQSWAMPCTPYAGPQVGFYAMPPVGALVWVEFEAGDPNYPIWVGCFWKDGDVPVPPVVPEKKVFKTEYITMILDDRPDIGGFTLLVNPPAVQFPLKMIFNTAGIEINAAPAIITMKPPAGITITFPPSTITENEGGCSIESTNITEKAAMTMGMTAGLEATVTAALIKLN